MITTIRLTPEGSAGSATATGTSELPVHGWLECIKTDLTSQPNTVDVTITEAGGLQRTLLTLTNMAASAVDFPRYQFQGSTGSDIADQYEKIYINGRINVAVAGADPVANGVVVSIQISQ